MNLRRSAILAAVALSTVFMGCSRNDIEAVNLAEEAKKLEKVDIDGAISKYDQATKLDPANDILFYKLALAYEKKEAWDKVASTMAAATRLNPKNATYFYKRGHALRMLAEKGPTSWDEPKDPLEKAIGIDPNYSEAYFDLGEVMLETDDEQRALENWTKAAQHNPAELIFYAPLGELYLNLGLTKQALDVTKEGLNFVKPDSDRGVVNLYVLQGAAFQAMGDLLSSAGALEKAKAADKEGQHPEILFNLGSTYAVMSPPKKQEALQMLKAFNTKACKGTKAAHFKAQCEQSQTLMQQVGGGAQ